MFSSCVQKYVTRMAIKMHNTLEEQDRIHRETIYSRFSVKLLHLSIVGQVILLQHIIHPILRLSILQLIHIICLRRKLHILWSCNNTKLLCVVE
jgi:hypothetical protein